MELARMANFLAACTGMRIGEVLGLRGEFVFADFIRVQGQYGQSGYGPTKTRTSRNIPLTPAIMDGLRRLGEINGNGYLFSTDGGAKPITRYYFTKYLATALEGIGIDAEEKTRRNLTPHAWRYCLNTNLRVRGVADAKVQSITRHKSQSMTERYTRFYTEEFTEVRTIQDTLLLPEGREAADSGTERTKQRPKASRRRMGGSRRAAKIAGAARDRRRNKV
jgi:integrase